MSLRVPLSSIIHHPHGPAVLDRARDAQGGTHDQTRHGMALLVLVDRHRRRLARHHAAPLAAHAPPLLLEQTAAADDPLEVWNNNEGAGRCAVHVSADAGTTRGKARARLAGAEYPNAILHLLDGRPQKPNHPTTDRVDATATTSLLELLIILKRTKRGVGNRKSVIHSIAQYPLVQKIGW